MHLDQPLHKREVDAIKIAFCSVLIGMHRSIGSMQEDKKGYETVGNATFSSFGISYRHYPSETKTQEK